MRGSLLVTDYEKFIFAGEGAVIYKNKIIDAMGEKAVFASPEKNSPFTCKCCIPGHEEGSQRRIFRTCQPCTGLYQKIRGRGKVEGLIIRELLEHDLPEVVGIENISFTTPGRKYYSLMKYISSAQLQRLES